MGLATLEPTAAISARENVYMRKSLGIGFLLLSLVSIGQAHAEAGPCTMEVPAINWFFGDLVSDEHIQQAVLCAVNRGGADVMGESSFRANYSLSILESDVKEIVVRPGTNKINEFKSNYSVSFPAYEHNRRVMISCARASIEYKQAPFENLTMTLSKCSANGAELLESPLRAQVVYSRIK